MSQQFSGIAKGFMAPPPSDTTLPSGAKCNPFVDAVAAGAAAGVAAFATAPLDKVKLR